MLFVQANDTSLLSPDGMHPEFFCTHAPFFGTFSGTPHPAQGW